LAQSRGDGHRSLVTPERVLSEYNKDFDFFLIISVKWMFYLNIYSIQQKMDLIKPEHS